VRALPEAGEHSRVVLAELGFEQSQIEDLISSGVVRQHA
jgi:crotonobetainyl-CoA:carnitine CoA-transferase CaiB-like acyl-CoA transferase